ncbi:hypothetical protein GIB67_018694, partial [Kingdonia uniflora]
GWGMTVTLGVPKAKTKITAHYGLLMSGKSLKGSLFGGWKPKSKIPLVDMYQRKAHCKEHFEDEEQHLLPQLEDIGLSEERQGSSVWK